MKAILIALMIFLTLGVTLAQQLLDTLGVNTNYLLIALTATIITQVISKRNKIELALVTIMTLLIIVQPAFLNALDINREMLLAALVALVITPDIYDMLH